MRLTALIVLACLFLFGHPAAPRAAAQDALGPGISVEQAAARMAEMDRARLAALQNYIATRHYTVHNKRFNKHAEMTVRMIYLFPGRKEFEVVSESGSSWIRNHVLRKMIQAELEATDGAMRNQTRITADNYQFRPAGVVQEAGRPFHVFELTPRTANKYLFSGRVWLDAEDAAVARIEGSPAQPPSFWTRDIRFVHRYDKHQQFWLPTSNHSETQVRIFGTTTVHIDYFAYRVNLPPSQIPKLNERNRIVRNPGSEAPIP
jgi:outer membrane lipoprotein-sorting protein